MSARRPHRTALLSRTGRLAASAATALLCSCAATGGLPGVPQASAPPRFPIPSSYAAPGSPVAADGFARVSAPAKTSAGPNAIQTVSFDAPAVAQPVCEFSPADGRMPVLMADGSVCATGCPDGSEFGACGAGSAAGLVGFSAPRPDEFLCDGGDRDLPVHYSTRLREGLDSEDTVAEWSDPAGGRHVVPSNKVCVYAPRYGEVRSFSGAAGGTKVDQLVSAAETTRGAGFETRLAPGAEVQKTRLEGVRVRSRASGIDVEHGLSGYDQATAAALDVEDTSIDSAVAFLQRGEIVRGQEAVLAKQMQSAVAWTRTLFPVVTATDVSSATVKAEFAPAELAGAEDMDKPGLLRIVKLADKAAAAAGEVVTFTIRYDNLGDKPVHHVRIVDNLTSRLELIEGSGTSDRAGRLDVEPNGEGSLVLTFVVDDPLPGKTGGVVTFKTTVK